MTDYNLHGLNPRDFQHMVQAIARKRIASGVTAFGDGADGARDLSYIGRMDYPSAAAPWDGYLVMGCKFQQRPIGDSGKDGKWALTQLERDLKKFLDKSRKLKKPDYYLFVTNVSLSGVAKTGGRDKTLSLLRKYSSKLRLKGYGIWDYNDLRGFLDGDIDLRSHYGHFITAGDVMAEIMKVLKLKRADFVEVMHSFLQKELIGDMAAKLQSAGEDPEVQIPLSSVFVDLPYAESPEEALLTVRKEKGEFPLVVNKLLEAGTHILRRSPDDENDISRDGVVSSIKISRFVIIGGPGQGKSTFGQYLCQIYRASILRDRPIERLDDHIPKIIRQLIKERGDDVGLPHTRRFPVRVELKNFAHALAAEPNLTLLEYIKRDIARLGSSKVSLEDLKVWLNIYPWLLVLDGLDEVPPSSNRSDVLREINSFRVDAASANSDLLVVATTRPQSYSKEFSEDIFEHLYLTPLSPSLALHYGRKLVEARCGADERRKDEVIRSLEKACKNPATTRLMQSPLQVTIMATLLEDTGEPPQQRYRLFAEYYRTIYKRETRRKLLGGILSERQKDIDTIHAQAGLILHSAGEQTGVSSTLRPMQDIDSDLSDDQFRKLVKRRLQQIRVPESKASELLNLISDGSLQRLVFLVRPKEGWVRFDITSFKEFMAAEALMTGSDEEIQKRLRVIAPISYWRNVFQFAVGKCFVEREHLLDNIVSLCTALNEDKACAEIVADGTTGRAAKAVLWGSRLALDILSDGTSRQHPGYELQLARIALQLVRLGDAETIARLASVFHEDLKEIYIEEIKDRLGQSRIQFQLGAWHLLLSLMDRDISWAGQILDLKWPTDIEPQETILARSGSQSKWAIQKIADILPKTNPYDLITSTSILSYTILSKYREVLFPHMVRDEFQLEVQNRSVWNDLFGRVFIKPIRGRSDYWQTLRTIDFEHKAWHPIIANVRFSNRPTVGTLAKELRWLATSWPLDHGVRFWNLQWPLAACLERATSPEDLLDFASAAEQGLLGNPKDWEGAERRWSEKGIVDADLNNIKYKDLPFGPDISNVGFPLCICVWMSDKPHPVIEFRSILERLDKIGNEHTRQWLANIIYNGFGDDPEGEAPWIISPDQFRKLDSFISNHSDYGWRAVKIDKLFKPEKSRSLNAEWIELFDWIGREQQWVRIGRISNQVAQDIIHHFCSNPEGRRGLLTMITQLAVEGYKPKIPDHVLDIAKGWSPLARDNANSLSILNDSITEAELVSLAQEILHSEYLYSTLSTAFRIASQVSQDQVARLALAILSRLDDSLDQIRQGSEQAQALLKKFLTNRPSLLQDNTLWKSLNLPERL